jgi:hypothetical protein
MCKIKKIEEKKHFFHLSKKSSLKNISDSTGELLKQLVEKIKHSDNEDLKDWSDCLYLAEDINVSLGYAEETSYVFEFIVENSFDYVNCTNEEFSKIEQNIEVRKAIMESVRDLIKGDPKDLEFGFMYMLSKMNYAFRCYADSDKNFELLVPPSILTNNFKIVKLSELDYNPFKDNKPDINKLKLISSISDI